MENYGSKLFKGVKYRDSFVMFGQRGVAAGSAREWVERKGNKDFAAAAKISGCAKIPRNNYLFNNKSLQSMLQESIKLIHDDLIVN
jgi:hypothetical protein